MALTYVLELRRRVLRVTVVFIGLFSVCFFFAQGLLQQLISPLLEVLPPHHSLIATHITAPLLTPIKLAADAALLSTAPYALLEMWCFVSPGLYRREKKNLRMAMFSSVSLFCMGLVFCFYGVLPFMLQCFANAVPNGVRFMPDMTDSVDFITHMLLLFGLCFQLPLLCFLGTQLNLINIKALTAARPYVTVAAFTLGMLLTPPDVLSQLMLAIPLCLLYELGIVLSRLGSLFWRPIV